MVKGRNFVFTLSMGLTDSYTKDGKSIKFMQIAHSNIYTLPLGFSKPYLQFLGTETATKISYIGAQTKLFNLGFTNTHDCLIT